MKINIIKFNYNKTILDLSLKLIYINLLFITIDIKFLLNGLALLKWTLLFFSIVLVISKLFLCTHKVIGSCYLRSNEIQILKCGQRIKYEHSMINSIDFKYGGYNGKEDMFEIFLKASWSKDGTNNLIRINQDSYQIYLDSKSVFEFVKNYMDEMSRKGINVNFNKLIF